MVIEDGNISFLPFIPRIFRGLYDLMAMARNGSKVGYTNFSAAQIFDMVNAPSELYYIYDVEDGRVTLGKSPKEAEKIFQSQIHSRLNIAEVIALAVHINMPSKHFVWACGFRYGKSDGA